MDIAGLSMALSTQKTLNDYGIAMLSKAMDNNEALGQGMVSMIEQTPAPSLESSVNGIGANIDIRL